MEIRIHGRGGQGGVTCAKLLAALYARLGKSVQAFGDYAGERSGAPVRAYVRVGDAPITNRNKVYRPDHVVVLDRTLLDSQALAGLAPGGLLLVNAPEPPGALAELAPGFRRGTVDATAIARRHGIGTRSVVIVNTTLAGAFARAIGLPWEELAAAYGETGLGGDLEAAREAWDGVRLEEPGESAAPPQPAADRVEAAPPHPVVDLVDHTSGPPPSLRTGTWRSQTPFYARHLSPCNAVCPAGNDVVGFVQELARGDEVGAATVLARTTPLPGVCGRVCPGFCMQGCNRRSLDGAVQVRDLERWVADHVPVAQLVGAAAHDGPGPLRVARVAVLGGGPAGLSAAYTLLRHGHRPTVFDAAPALGGLLRSGIPSYRLPWEVVAREIRALLDLGMEERCGTALGPAQVEDLLGGFDGLVLATGQQRRRTLALPGSDLDGVEQGLDFLGSAEGTLHEFPLADHVVVLGGGNTAIDCARSAIRRGARRVTLAYRRSRDEMPAIPEEVDEAVEEGVELLFLRAPVAFYGDDSPRPGEAASRLWVAGVELAEMRLGPPDASGRRRPEMGEGRVRLDCDLVLLALGQSADEQVLPPGWAVDGDRMTCEGRPLPVTLAGDFATNEGTVAHAVGDGRRAAQALLWQLGEPVSPWQRPDLPAAVPFERIRAGHFALAPPALPRHRVAGERRHDWLEVAGGLPSAAEAARCFACGDCTECDTCLVYCPDGAISRRADGGYLIDYDVCKGCGVCAAECPRYGMEMVETCRAS